MDIKEEPFGVVYGTLRFSEGSNADLGLMLNSFGSAVTIWAATDRTFSLIGRTGRVGAIASEELVEPGIFVFPLPDPPANGLIEILIEYSYRAVVWVTSVRKPVFRIGEVEEL